MHACLAFAMYVQRGKFISSSDIERRWKMKKLTAFKYTEKDDSLYDERTGRRRGARPATPPHSL